MTFFLGGFPATTLKSFVALGGGRSGVREGSFYHYVSRLRDITQCDGILGEIRRDWKWHVDTRLKKVGRRRMKSLHVHVLFWGGRVSLYKFSLGSAALLVNRWNDRWFILSFFIITNTRRHKGKLNQMMHFRVETGSTTEAVVVPLLFACRYSTCARCTRLCTRAQQHERQTPLTLLTFPSLALLPWHFPGVKSILI